VQVLWYAVCALLGSGGHQAVYAAVERPLQFAQTAAVMEVIPFLSLPLLLPSYIIIPYRCSLAQ
jgi:hypothetical protein